MRNRMAMYEIYIKIVFLFCMFYNRNFDNMGNLRLRQLTSVC